MFRYFTAILLFIAFGTQTFQRAFMVLDYYANTGSFAKKCENRFRPQMHCNGQCLLMKKLKEQENKEKQNPERKQENKNEVIFSGSAFASLNIFSVEKTSTAYPAGEVACTINMPRAFFHPPNVSHN
jgi:hypothetical protein